MKTYIDFKKQRELGEIFTDTFAFIRNEYKPLFKSIIAIAGPYLLLFLFALVFYIYTMGGQFNLDFTNPQANANLFYWCQRNYINFSLPSLYYFCHLSLCVYGIYDIALHEIV
ncbi:hypothetical protein N7U66_06525 [Lacinutrix neustonica]|uniref:Uncharacterized protein n=1 Tax=Lacinutrix neustonica TaxID=2980107 RepID=A0A9E8MZP8_9FLAO|nr:hypothetical protein [Lacinutrix neustonica]WAC03224.1 hypothetical protein N7U66_06525 [Lacinutrix neustonica]